MAETLYDLAVLLRQRGNRPCTDADLSRLRSNIAGLTATEKNEQRKLMTAALAHADRVQP